MARPPQKPGSPRPPSAFDPAQPQTQSLGDAVRYNEELGREVAALEEGVELLRARYDLWFVGVERREPAREREEAKRQVQRLKGTFTRNTGLRFRIQSLHARFLSYERMWQRSAREKEEGTYRRDVQRARRMAERAAAKGGPAGAQQDGATPPPAQPSAQATAARPAAPEARPAARPAGPPPARVAVPGMTDGQIAELHAAFVAAKRQCNEDTSRFSVDVLARSLAKQVPELLSRFQATRVEFRVAIKDGKPILKAVPRT